MGCGCMDYVEIPVPNVVLRIMWTVWAECGAHCCDHGAWEAWQQKVVAVTSGDIGPWRHCSVIMVPEIHIIDENPPIFDLEWMDQCVDKVSWILLDN